ncbi:olfactory receptor 6B1-like [Pelodytes ibericus]
MCSKDFMEPTLIFVQLATLRGGELNRVIGTSKTKSHHNSNSLHSLVMINLRIVFEMEVQDTLDMNKTRVTTFLLLGFQISQIFKIGLFILFLVIYILTLHWNLLIIVLVSKVPSLKSPMYFFLTQLSLSDIFLTTTIAPKMLHVIINGGSTISFTGCITQFYFYCVFSAVECLLLTVMSYDRYLAICLPLHYVSIMVLRLRLQLVLWSWVLALIVSFIFASLLFNLEFCGPKIDHYFCDLAPMLTLSCTDPTFVEIADFIFGIPYILVPFLYILYTYISIFITILGISSTISKQKAFSTCSSHLIVVSTYYMTLITIYMMPSKGQSFNVNKVLSLLYTIGTPFFNPIIYSLRNQDIKKVLLKYVSCSLS